MKTAVYIKGIAVCLLSIVILAVTFEFGLSIFVERSLAKSLDKTPLRNTPSRTSLPFFPNSIYLARGTAPTLQIVYRDLPDAVPGMPYSTIFTEYSDLRFDWSDVKNDDWSKSTFDEGTVRITIDNSALSAMTKIRDLQVRSLNDDSPLGTPEEHLMMTGTVVHGSVQVKISVDAHVYFDIKDQRLRVVPIKILQDFGSLGLSATQITSEEALMRPFELNIWMEDPPLGLNPKLAFAQGSSVIVVGPTEESPFSQQKAARISGGTKDPEKWDSVNTFER